MSSSFIRGLWGFYSKETRTVARRYKIDDEIRITLNNKYTPPYVTYVFGEDNLKQLEDLGINNLRLMSKEPFTYDLNNSTYRHKLDILKSGLEDFDEVIYIDWDCQAQKALPENFWEVVRSRGFFQANLQQYKNRQCFWRPDDKRKVPNGGFLYTRDKEFVNEATKLWKTGRGCNDEPFYARSLDNRFDGWMGKEKYLELYEPYFCNLWKGSVYTKDEISFKDVVFIHYQGIGTTTNKRM